jgi:hypothetical protein
MEHINAPNFGVITKIKKIKLETKKLDRWNEFLDFLVKSLILVTIAHVIYRFW